MIYLAFSAILILESVFFIEKFYWLILQEFSLKIGKILSRVAHFIPPGDAKYLLGAPLSDYVTLARQ